MNKILKKLANDRINIGDFVKEQKILLPNFTGTIVEDMPYEFEDGSGTILIPKGSIISNIKNVEYPGSGNLEMCFTANIKKSNLFDITLEIYGFINEKGELVDIWDNEIIAK